MYVHSVELINYKSIGDTDATIILEPNITAIIGMNESGKSNVLEGLSHINFLKRDSSAFSPDAANRNQYDNKINYRIILKSGSDDHDIADTMIEISEGSYKLTGGLLAYYENTAKETFSSIATMLDEIKQNPFGLKDNELSRYRKYINMWKDPNGVLDVPLTSVGIDFLQARLNNIPEDKRQAIKDLLEEAVMKWQDVTERLPVFFFRKGDKHLKRAYKYADIENELNKPASAGNSLLNELVKILGITKEEFLEASKSGNTTAKQITSQKKINRLINENINTGFQKFYTTEKISLEVTFNNGCINFTVQSSGGEALMLDERSNGLRWFLDLYIDVAAHDLRKRNIVYLLDEPGVSLHINAQKELLRLFDMLAQDDNQVVYSTHLPSMLNMQDEGYHRIRAVAKDLEGNTHIFKTPYDSRISSILNKTDSGEKSPQKIPHDTLAPVITAMGMNLYDTIGPAYGKLNIVTEGMSDYIFLFTMAKYLNLDTSKFAIIPSQGVTTCINLCMILHGWGCDYIALFDFDEEGVEKGGEYLRREMEFEEGTRFLYVREVSSEEILNKEYTQHPFVIEDVFGKQELEAFRKSNNISSATGKPLVAKLICTEIEKGTLKPSDQCVERFKALFERLLRCPS